MKILEEQNDMHNMTDDEVFVASLSNSDLFSEIIDRYQQLFIKKATDILGNREDALDAVQESFVRIYSAARQYRKMENASFKSWAYRILINQCFTMYQKNKKDWVRTCKIEEEFMNSIPDQSEINEYDNKLSKDYLMSFVSKLPAVLARTVELYFVHGIPQKEIAESENVSNEVIRSRIHKSKKELLKMGINNY